MSSQRESTIKCASWRVTSVISFDGNPLSPPLWLDAGGLHDLRPLRDLGADVLAELGRRGERGLDSRHQKPLPYVGQAEYAHYLLMEPGNDLARRAGGRQHAHRV